MPEYRQFEAFAHQHRELYDFAGVLGRRPPHTPTLVLPPQSNVPDPSSPCPYSHYTHFRKKYDRVNSSLKKGPPNVRLNMAMRLWTLGL
eukprot:NODE_6625_length_443_cov_319.329949_g5054_i0.p2 GENE.NODE_6625_length_443_cov_319.329949_g5054_i0~~NODE_6625_length_443_cov_319.329949_g5054_i0.p2  ORF type:complete len:89 (-),score=4.86 NODE_6625_length_443_cov_319.329949_g5054_i0:92-358(-)